MMDEIKQLDSAIDKSKWGNGEWKNEPDFIQYVDKKTGYPCLIIRSTSTGCLLGYVGIPKSNGYFGMHCNEIDICVHGGLTQSLHTSQLSHIFYHCMMLQYSEYSDYWWLGFDTEHWFDFCPKYGDRSITKDNKSYKDVRYVKSHIRYLARQCGKNK